MDDLKKLEELESTQETEISEKEYSELKQLEALITQSQNKIGALEFNKFILVRDLDELIKKHKDHQMFLFKKYELDPSKSYSIDDDRKFVLRN